jgi:hypothetical protein
MAAAAHGDVAADLTGEAHSRSDVSRRDGLGDNPRTSVYVAVPHARCAHLVVICVVRVTTRPAKRPRNEPRASPSPGASAIGPPPIHSQPVAVRSDDIGEEPGAQRP